MDVSIDDDIRVNINYITLNIDVDAFVFKSLFVYLAVPGLNCGMGIFDASCGVLIGTLTV